MRSPWRCCFAGAPLDEQAAAKMPKTDSRQIPRDRLLLLATLRVNGSAESHRVTIRNLSPRGLMAEGDLRVSRGELVAVELRNLGWVEGWVAWRQENRFGVAFIDEVDPSEAREASSW